MTYVVQRADRLRDMMLEFIAAHYEEHGEEIDTSQDSDAFRTASAHALALEALHAHALKVESSIFPDTALTEDLEHHARVLGLARKPASAARLTVMVSNGLATVETYSVNGATLNRADGVKYRPIDPTTGEPLSEFTTGALGTADLVCEAVVVGVEGNAPIPSSLVWSSAPSGILSNATVVVGPFSRTGADAELDPPFAQRVLRWMRNRPAAGNCAEWQDWCERFEQVEAAFVYPATKPDAPTQNRTPGAVTVVIVGAGANRVLLPADAGAVKDYIEGRKRLDGIPNDNPRVHMLRFAALDEADITIMVPTTATQDVVMDVTIRGESLPSWRATPFEVDASGTSTTSSLKTTTADLAAAGLVLGSYLAIENPAVRGGYEVRKVAALSTNSITLDAPLSAVPTAGRFIRAAWSRWEAARDAVFAVFDTMGPGDYSADVGGPTRFPLTDELGPDRLYRSALVSVVVGVPVGGAWTSGVQGVIAASVTTPLTDMQADPFELIVPGAVYFTMT